MPAPNPDDDVLDNVVELPISEPEEEEAAMPAVPEALHEQNLGRLAGAGAQAHEHFVQFGKILDLSYEADRKMVSLVESLGVREVTSQSGQLGVPNAAQSGKTP